MPRRNRHRERMRKEAEALKHPENMTFRQRNAKYEAEQARIRTALRGKLAPDLDTVIEIQRRKGYERIGTEDTTVGIGG